MPNFYSTEALKNVPHFGDVIAMLPAAYATPRAMNVTTRKYNNEFYIRCCVVGEQYDTCFSATSVGAALYHNKQLMTLPIADTPVMTYREVNTSIAPGVTCIIRTEVEETKFCDFMKFGADCMSAIEPFKLISSDFSLGSPCDYQRFYPLPANMLFFMAEPGGKYSAQQAFERVVPFVKSSAKMCIWRPLVATADWVLVSDDYTIAPLRIIDKQRARDILEANYP